MKPRNIWTRGLYMLLFAFLYGVVKLFIAPVVVLQFIVVAVRGTASEPLRRFGSSLSRVVYDIVAFATFNREELPFPFDDWPDSRGGPPPESRAGEPDAAQPVQPPFAPPP